MIPPVRLETPRLVLREFAGDDWRAVHEYASDPEVVKYMEWGPNTEAQSRDHYDRVSAEREAVPRLQYSLAVTLRENGALIGGCRLGIGSEDDRRADLGYVFNRKHWGNGYATEAVRALLRFGFETLKMHRIWATCHAANAASARVLEKAGLRYEGRLREDRFQKGEWRDTLVFSMLEGEWRRIAAGKDFLVPGDRE